MPKAELILAELVTTLAVLPEHHARTSHPYILLDQIAQKITSRLFSTKDRKEQLFGPFGPIVFPFFKMGAISSKQLFGLDELILFSFYWTNRHLYKKALDIGANIGLHTLLMQKSGFEVSAFEPDPIHFARLKETLDLNHASERVRLFQGAVSDRDGSAEFTRVLGNTTSSHLSGAKVPYGKTERFSVTVYDFRKLIREADLVKMDVERHEGILLLATNQEDWKKTDALAEIGSEENARKVFSHFTREGVHLFAQKLGWKRVERLEDMPTSYREGSLFISTKSSMPWAS